MLLSVFGFNNRIARGKDDGGGSSYSPPPAPDPYQTAAAQGGQDRATAQTNAVLLNPNIKSPFGTISYDTNSYNVDPSNTTVTRPTQITTLNPAQQRQLDARNQISDYLNTAGIGLAQQMPSTQLLAPTTPVRPTSIDYSNVDPTQSINSFEDDRKRVEDAVYQRQMRLLQPEFDNQLSALENKLIQTGNPVGSEYYNKEMDRFQRGRDETLAGLANQAVLAGGDEQTRMLNAASNLKTQQLADSLRPYQTATQLRSDQIAEGQLLRNQQINELAALLQGREAITLPVGGQYNQAALRAPDLAGLTQQAYQSNLNNYNAQYMADQQAQNSYNQGLFGIGSSLANLGARFLFA